MPVHRHQHAKQGSVYAFRSDLDAWARSRQGVHAVEDAQPPLGIDRQPEGPERIDSETQRPATGGRRTGVWIACALGVVLIAGFTIWQLGRRDNGRPLLQDARFQPLTDFGRNRAGGGACRATEDSWPSSRIATGEWTCGSRRSARASSTT